MVRKEEKNKRDVFIDILRGLAVFLVLWGHCVQYFSQNQFDFFENFIFRLIYSFHMPLFMVISGYLFYITYSKYSFKECIIKYVKGILLPVFVWDLKWVNSKIFLVYSFICNNSFIT